MLLIIIFAAIGLFIGIKKAKDGDKIDKTCFPFIGTLAGSIIGSILFFLIFAALPHKMQLEEYEKTTLVSLGNSSDLEGSMFLATGFIGTEEYYRFYELRKDGGKQFGKISASNAVVYEEDRADGYISKVKEWETPPQWFLRWVAIKFAPVSVGSFQHYAIHVPKGTVQKGFKLDLK